MTYIKNIAEALQYVHNEGYIYRDVKPKNMLITNEKEEIYYAYLEDFGITKDVSRETEVEDGKGSYLYFPSEFILGREEHTKENDIYGLGMSMYEILTGKHPRAMYTTRAYVEESRSLESFIASSEYNKDLTRKINEMCLKSINKTWRKLYQDLK